jgi:hypothetical protein
VYAGKAEEADDVLAIIELIEHSGKLALVEGAEVEHHHSRDLKHLYRKYWHRTADGLVGRQGFLRRKSRMSIRRRLKRWLWIPYSIALVPPSVHGAFMAVRHRDPILLFHPIVNTAVFLAVARGTIAAKLAKS